MADRNHGGGVWSVVLGLAGGAVGRIIAGILAGLLAAFGLVQTKPEAVLPVDRLQQVARPDPFTGTEGRELERRIRELERVQAIDDQHRLDAATGYTRIRELERRCQENNSRITAVEAWLNRLEDQSFREWRD
jgi:hypothetical protein